jgi:hypothetical protein
LRATGERHHVPLRVGTTCDFAIRERIPDMADALCYLPHAYQGTDEDVSEALEGEAKLAGVPEARRIDRC